jgi:holo-[acyl-carrier protein] synthase
MNIVGLGMDLAEVERVRRLLEQYPGFPERVFTEHERRYAARFANPARRYAARFAAKEAVMKSLGVGWRDVRWRDIEVTGGGRPTVRLSGTAAARAESLGVAQVLVTITHTDHQAMVVAIALAPHQ